MKRSEIIHDQKNNTLKTKLKIVKNVLLSLVAALLIIVIVQSLTIKRDPNYIPRIFGATYLNVLTESMEPDLKVNDLAIGLKVKDTSTLEVGDVITYKDGRMLITHRIVEISDKGTFVMKGDANKSNDENEVTSKQVVSKFAFKIPKGGYVVAKFQDIIFLGLVWLIIMYSLVKEIFNESKKIKKAKLDKHETSQM